MPYMYKADIYCDACGEHIKQAISDAKTPANIEDERTYDSDDYPKFCTASEADSPQHCGSDAECLDPLEINGTKYGAFLENPLTEDGAEYVLNEHAERATDITKFWLEFYDYLKERATLDLANYTDQSAPDYGVMTLCDQCFRLHYANLDRLESTPDSICDHCGDTNTKEQE